MIPTPLKRLILGAIALVVLLMLSSSLLGSLGEPQITDRIQLYQTDLLLHATELGTGNDSSLAESRSVILGEKPIAEALKQYQEVRQTASTNLQQFQKRLQQSSAYACQARLTARNRDNPAIESRSRIADRDPATASIAATA